MGGYSLTSSPHEYPMVEFCVQAEREPKVVIDFLKIINRIPKIVIVWGGDINCYKLCLCDISARGVLTLFMTSSGHFQ